MIRHTVGALEIPIKVSVFGEKADNLVAGKNLNFKSR
jgi:hypothetical protein